MKEPSFRTDLSTVPWSCVLIEQEHNPDIAWDIWQHMFLDITDSHAPLKKKRVKGISSPLDYSRAKKADVSERQTPKIGLKVSNRWQLDFLQRHEEFRLIIKLRMLT